MHQIAASHKWHSLESFAHTALKTAAKFWFLVSICGQWIFVYYVTVFYGGSALRGDWNAWNAKFPHGHVPGDSLGNTAIAVHLLLAVIIMLGGPLQLVPQIRARFPALHRWNGRVYMTTVFITSLVGLYMVWVRGGSVGSTVQHLGISLDAILIMTFAIVAVRHAIARDIKTHRRYALRLLMVVSGVWFFRIGLMFWIVINKGPAGFDPDTFTGPFLNFISFADYLLPLAFLEIYFLAQDRGAATMRIAAAVGLFILTIAMVFGVFAATKIMWLPNL